MGKVTFINSIISGKVAGQVYSRNRAGAYVRQWVKPINPRTLAQQSARTNFGTASNRYHTLSNAQKANWNAFAPFYNNKSTGLPNGLSGFNVFVATNQLAQNAEDLQATNQTIKKNGTGTALANTATPFTGTDIAPAHQLIATMAADSETIHLIPGNITLSPTIQSDRTFNIDMEINTTGLTGSNDFQSDFMRDTNSNHFGFAFYISNQTQQIHNFKANPEIICIGTISSKTLTTPTTGCTNLTFYTDGNIDPSRYQSLPDVGNTVNLTLYQIGINGMANKLKTVPVTIS